MTAASILALQTVDESSRRYLTVVERSARAMQRLISDLLDVARIEAGTFALRREVLDLCALVEDTVEVFQAQAHAKDVGFRCVRVTNDDRAVRSSVRDSGAGIREEDLPRVFDRFWQADPASNAGGAGLGLSICRDIVEAHGGRIGAVSTAGRGATFHFTVPARR